VPLVVGSASALGGVAGLVLAKPVRGLGRSLCPSRLRPPAREHLKPKLWPPLQPVRGGRHSRAADPLLAQRLGLGLRRARGGGVCRQQQPRTQFGQLDRHHRPSGPPRQVRRPGVRPSRQRPLHRLGERLDQCQDRQPGQVDLAGAGHLEQLIERPLEPVHGQNW